MFTFLLFNLHFFLGKKEQWLSNELRKKYGFFLGNLPFVAIQKVLDFMIVEEKIKLALTSTKMEKLVKMKKTQIECYYIYPIDEASYIEILTPTEESMTLFCGRNAFKPLTIGKITRQDVQQWCSPKTKVVDNTINVFNRVTNLFPCPYFYVMLYLSNMRDTNIQEFLSIPDIQNFECLMIDGYYNMKISTEDLNFIMDKFGNMNKQIWIKNTTIPLDYTHKNAFKFEGIYYEEARWIHIEDLFSLQNSHTIELGWKNNFTSHDFMKLVDYWLISECNMFQKLYIEMKRVWADPRKLIENLITLQGSLPRNGSFLFLAKNRANRKYPIGSVYWTDATFVMFTYSSEKAPREWDILNILHRKIELEEELTTVRREISEMEYQLTEEKKLEFEKKILKRKDLNNEFEELMEKLANYNVHFVNGRAVME